MQIDITDKFSLGKNRNSTRTEGISMVVSKLSLKLKLVLPAVTSIAYMFFLQYLSSIHKKAMYRYVLDCKSALALELLFLGHLSFT